MVARGPVRMDSRALYVTTAQPPPPCTEHAWWTPCPANRRRTAWLDATRQAAIADGTWEGKVDRSAAAEHLRRYVKAGGSLTAASRTTGVGRDTLNDLVNGHTVRRAHIMADTRDAILALPIPDLRQPPHAMTYAAGTLRRIRALMRDGWPSHIQADAHGVSKFTVLSVLTRPGPDQWVTDTVAAAVAAGTAALYGADRPGRSAWTAGRAERAGWHWLEWWADIDDPLCEPVEPDWRDDVIIAALLAGDAARMRPRCWGPEHTRGRGLPSCIPCRRWQHNRNAAILHACAPPPDGLGWPTGRIAERIGSNEKTVQRVRAAHGMSAPPGTNPATVSV